MIFCLDWVRALWGQWGGGVHTLLASGRKGSGRWGERFFLLRAWRKIPGSGYSAGCCNAVKGEHRP